MRSRISSPRSSSSCTCCTDSQLRRGPWTAEEDGLLLRHMKLHGDRGNWRKVPKAAGLLRCGKSCRLRWLNYLRPDLKRGGFSEDEDDLIIKLHRLLGNRWSLIAGRIPGRSDNEIKNYWNFHLGKKLLKMGINPKTHRPISDTPVTAKEDVPKRNSTFCHSNSFSSISSSVTSCDEDQSWASMDSKLNKQEQKNIQEYEVFSTEEFINNWSKAHGIHPNNPIPQNPDPTDGHVLDHCTEEQEGALSSFTLDELDNMMGYWQQVSGEVSTTVPPTERACVDFWS